MGLLFGSNVAAYSSILSVALSQRLRSTSSTISSNSLSIFSYTSALTCNSVHASYFTCVKQSLQAKAPILLSKISKKLWNHFSICACHPCAGAMLIFSVSFQFYHFVRRQRISNSRLLYTRLLGWNFKYGQILMSPVRVRLRLWLIGHARGYTEVILRGEALQIALLFDLAASALVQMLP